MNPVIGGALIMGGTQLLGSALNYGAQQSNLQYMKDMQYKAWSREDSAMVRRVNDLKAAGLSPTLAAGQGAASSSPIRTEAPQFDMPQIDLISMYKTMADVDRTKEDIKVAQLQQKKMEDERANIKSSTYKNLIDAARSQTEAGKTALESMIKQYDFDIFKSTGLPTNASGVGRMIQDALQLGKKGAEYLSPGETEKPGVRKKIENLKDFQRRLEREKFLETLDKASPGFKKRMLEKHGGK